MSTATVRRNSKAWKSALNMIAKRGGKLVTFYQPGIVEQARKGGLKVRVIERGVEVVKSARMTHRPDLMGSFGETHENNGSGKYVNQDAIKNGVVVGAVKVGRSLSSSINPYLTTDGSYHTIMQAFQTPILSSLATTRAEVSTSRLDGVHLTWRGRIAAGGELLASPWVTMDQLWDQCLEMNPDLEKVLRKAKSQRSKVKRHKTPREKFGDNVQVMRRCRESLTVGTGESKYGGGATPYGFPITQCGMAIDMAFLTDGFDESGEEAGNYYYRLVVGRTVAQNLLFQHWKGLTPGSRIGYLNDKVRAEAIQALKSAA